MLRLCLLAGVLLALAAPAGAAFMPLAGGGVQSGWKIRLSGAASSYGDVVVDPNVPKTVFLTIGVDYGPATDPEDPPTAIMEFQQFLTDANTASRIVIRNETIHNSSDDPLNCFNWYLPYFNVSSFQTDTDWSVSPFTAAIWDANTIVATSNNWLWNGATLTASGDLVIDVDLSGPSAYFVLKQTSAPEPATMAVLGGGAVLLGLRRRRFWSRPFAYG